MRKRYRYITNGCCHLEDPICDYRLSATATSQSIRVEIPDDMVLKKLSCDCYSTTEDKRLIKELNPQAMIRINGELRIVNSLLKYEPHDWHKFV